MFDDDGKVREYVGGYDDWVHQRQQDLQEEVSKSKVVLKRVKSGNKKAALTYQEQLDLTALPKKIEKLELKQSELLNRLGQPEFYQQKEEKVAEMQEQLAQLMSELEDTYELWQQLEAKQTNN